MNGTSSSSSSSPPTVLSYLDVNSNSLRVGVGLLVAVLSYVLYSFSSSQNGKGIYRITGFSLFTAWTFFEKRHDFLWSHFRHHSLFQFKVLQYNVVALSGEQARKLFYSHPSLSFNEGYKIFMGGAPLQADGEVEDIALKNGDATFFNKYLLKLLHKDRVQDVFPTLFEDVNKRMEGWGATGRIDPFDNVYHLVFQMTARMATCNDLAKDRAVVSKIYELFMTLEKSATPAALLLPWLPSKAKRNQKKANVELYNMLSVYVDARRKETPTSDAIDVLIGEGLKTGAIVGWVLSVMFAGVINTGINACWILIYLAINPEWKERVRQECEDLVVRQLGPNTSGAPLHQRLASIPLPAWEDEMPILDAIIRETLRICVTGTTLRRNVVDDISFGGKVIGKGDFMAYSIADVHLNDNIYPNPMKFDPGRFLNGDKPVSNVVYPYLGWGVGRHPCTGMRVAKLEMKMITSLLILGYDFKLVDRNGNFPNPLPLPDRNDHHQVRPLGDPTYLEFKRVVN